MMKLLPTNSAFAGLTFGPVSFAKLGLALLLPISAALGAPTQYVVYDLGTLGIGSSEAFSINEAGQIVGRSNHPGGVNSHAFLYSGGSMIDVGTLGAGTNSSGLGINNLGQVTGISTILSIGIDFDAFLYSGGILTNIGTSLGNSAGFAINDSGQVAGYRTNGGSPSYQAFIRTGGSYFDIPDLGANSFAWSINESGAVGGTSDIAGTGFAHAFLYANSVTTDLGTLGGDNSVGQAINSSNQVAGNSQITPGTIATHAFLSSSSGLIDLGTLGGASSAANGLNDQGWVVGSAQMSTGGQAAFLYADGAMRNLNDLTINLNAAGFTLLSTASDINNKGWIVGSGTTVAGEGHAYLAVPTSVPDTGSVFSYLLGSLLLLALPRIRGRG